MIRYIIIGAVISLSFTACSTQRGTSRSAKSALNPTDYVKNYSHFKPEYSCLVIEDAQVEYNDGLQKQSFIASIKMIKDSAVIISVVPGLGIEAFRLIISKDSVWALDRINRKLYYGDLKNFSDKFGLPGKIGMMQDIILGYAGELLNEPNQYTSKINNSDIVFNYPDSLYTFPFEGYRIKEFSIDKKNGRMTFFTLASNGILVKADYKSFIRVFKMYLANNQEFNIYIKGKASKLKLQFTSVRKGIAGDWSNFGGRNYDRIPLTVN